MKTLTIHHLETGCTEKRFIFFGWTLISFTFKK